MHKGSYFNGSGKKPGEIIVVRLDQISSLRDPFKKRTELKADLSKEISRLTSNELLMQYISSAQKELGLNLYEKNLDLAFEQLLNRSP